MKAKLFLTVTVVALFTAHNAAASLYSSGAVAIPDYPGTGASSLITSSGSGLVGVSSLTFTISGGWAGDYTLALQYTDGSATASTTFFSGLQGGLAANNGFTGVTLTSASGNGDITTAGSTTLGASAITGTYTVDFSAFNNVSANGNWILFVQDLQSGDSGTLTGWSLNITPVPEPVNVALVVFGAGFCVFGTMSSYRASKQTKNLAAVLSLKYKKLP